MKIGGVKIDGPCEEILVLPRVTSDDLVFRARSVPDLDEFETRCPMPVCQKVLGKGGWKENLDDPTYKQALIDRGTLQHSYMVLRSLEPSDIEWDTVDMGNPSTWTNWNDDLTNAGLSVVEVNRVILCVSTANSLNEGMLEEARENFLLGLAKEASDLCSSQDTEKASTPSGEPQSDSE